MSTGPGSCGHNRPPLVGCQSRPPRDTNSDLHASLQGLQDSAAVPSWVAESSRSRICSLRAFWAFCFAPPMTTQASPKSVLSLLKDWPGVPWRMCQRQEHLSGLATTLSDVVFDYRVLAQEPVLICQAVKDTPGRVTLLLRQRLIVLQDTVNHSLCTGGASAGVVVVPAGTREVPSTPASC